LLAGANAQWVSGNDAETRKLEQVLARDGEKCGCDGRIDETLWLRVVESWVVAGIRPGWLV
jgi:hypothetical protein